MTAAAAQQTLDAALRAYEDFADRNPVSPWRMGVVGICDRLCRLNDDILLAKAAYYRAVAEQMETEDP